MIHIRFAKTDFNCPNCGKEYTERDYKRQLEKAKQGYTHKNCKCGYKIGVAIDYRGDVAIWISDFKIYNPCQTT